MEDIHIANPVYAHTQAHTPAVRLHFSIDNLWPHVLSDTKADSSCSHWAASVSEAYGSSICRPMSGRLNQRVPSQQGPWLTSQTGGSCSHLPCVGRGTLAPPDAL